MVKDLSTESSKDKQATSSDNEPISKIPDMELAQLRFQLVAKEVSKEKKQQIWTERVLPTITEHNMAPFYREVCTETSNPLNDALYATMAAENEKTIKVFDAEIKDAETNLGESEIREAWFRKAKYLCAIGDKDGALSAFRHTYEKTVGIGNRIDVVLQLIRIGMFYNDHALVQSNMAKVKQLMDQGGDWDRRNRLKAYEALYTMSTRDFKTAAKLFLEAVPTFSSYELFTYEELVFYSVITSMLALDRPELKNEVLKGSEIQEQLSGGGKDGTLALAKKYVEAFYDCNYAQFFMTLADLEVQRLKLDRYLAPHVGYYSRAMRVKAYQQFLSPYKSVSLVSMAHEFGVSPTYMDTQLHTLVAGGRLHCRIDAVRGIVETIRADNKNDSYKSVISHGDVLLNRVQKLARVVNE